MSNTAYVYRWDDALIPRIQSSIEGCDLNDYRIEIGCDGNLLRCLEAAVNQGIDSHLEAVKFQQGVCTRGAGSAAAYDTPVFKFDTGTLHVLIRRLAEPLPQHWDEQLDDEQSLGDAMQSLANDILYTLDIPAEIYG